MQPFSTCTASRKTYVYNKAHLQEFREVLQAWMMSQMPGSAEGLRELVCDKKSLRGFAI
jgi:hypothetical protein